MDVVKSLKEFGIKVTIFDPWAKQAEVKHEYNLEITNQKPQKTFDAIVLGVAHNEFLDIDFESLKKEKSVIYDVKGVLKIPVDGKL